MVINPQRQRCDVFKGRRNKMYRKYFMSCKTCLHSCNNLAELLFSPLICNDFSSSAPGEQSDVGSKILLNTIGTEDKTSCKKAKRRGEKWEVPLQKESPRYRIIPFIRPICNTCSFRIHLCCYKTK